MIKKLVNQKILHTPHIIDAFMAVDRRHFMREEYKSLADIDTALPIGKGQTISQPLTVATMIELLQPQKGDKILEIGYGSGWQTAILSNIVGIKGEIVAYEIIDEISKFGEENLYNFLESRALEKITLLKEDYKKSFEKHSPFDRIISAASFKEYPKDLINSLSEKGKFVFPTSRNDIRLVEKLNGKVVEQRIPGFIFVPITH
jgi:protein-L-isoaspartate(D-aspartate) O-methyltransferase